MDKSCLKNMPITFVPFIPLHICTSLPWIYCYQNLYIEEEQTTQWPKEKVQKDKQSTKHTHKTKDPATRTPLKTGGVNTGADS
jgi:hypothetical protein